MLQMEAWPVWLDVQSWFRVSVARPLLLGLSLQVKDAGPEAMSMMGVRVQGLRH